MERTRCGDDCADSADCTTHHQPLQCCGCLVGDAGLILFTSYSRPGAETRCYNSITNHIVAAKPAPSPSGATVVQNYSSTEVVQKYTYIFCNKIMLQHCWCTPHATHMTAKQVAFLRTSSQPIASVTVVPILYCRDKIVRSYRYG